MEEVPGCRTLFDVTKHIDLLNSVNIGNDVATLELPPLYIILFAALSCLPSYDGNRWIYVSS